MRISFVVPVYNEGATIEKLVQGIREGASPNTVQIIFVDDGSTDDSPTIFQRIARVANDVQFVRFEQNRGKTAALAEGFVQADGELVFTMDGDLQDDPAEIPRFLAKLDEGYDLVSGWKSVRRDPFGRRFMSRLYNACVGSVFGLSLHDINCGYKAMRPEVAQSLELHHDFHRLIPVMADARGFRVGEIEVKHHPRRHGKSRYGFERYWKGARDVCRLWWTLRREK